ncbi:1988_t:CDS:1, partial [Paraglomus occultum]
MGKFTDNPKQYLQLLNTDKYEHIYDPNTEFISVRNIRKDKIVGVFDYNELRVQITSRYDEPQGSDVMCFISRNPRIRDQRR